MMNVAVILIVGGLAVVHSATLNALESKDDQKGFDLQSTIPSIMESTTGITHSESFAPLRLKTISEDKTILNEKKMSNVPFPPQEDQPSGPPFLHNSGFKTEQNRFQSGHPVTSLPSQSSGFGNFNGQPIFPGQDPFYSGDTSQHTQEQMFGDKQNEYEQSFYGDNQNARQYFGDQELPQQRQDFYGNSHETVQQREFSGSQQLTPEQQILYSGAQSKKSQEQIFNAQHQPTGEHHFYSSGLQMGDHRGKSMESRMKSQVFADKQLFSVQTQGLSAFNTRKQPLMLPRSSLHSSSLIVSGLNHLPMLPALVYNSGPVPSSHAVAIAKGAAVHQHLQTPYVRYVYSHLL